MNYYSVWQQIINFMKVKNQAQYKVLLDYLRVIQAAQKQLRSGHQLSNLICRLDRQNALHQSIHLFWKYINSKYFTLTLDKSQSLRAISDKITLFTKQIQLEPIQAEQDVAIQNFCKSLYQQNSQDYQPNQIDQQLYLLQQQYINTTKLIDTALKKLIFRSNSEHIKPNYKKQDLRQWSIKMINQRQLDLFRLSIIRVQQDDNNYLTLYMDKSLHNPQVITNLENVQKILNIEEILRLLNTQNFDEATHRWCHFCRTFKLKNQVSNCGYREIYSQESKLGMTCNPFKYLYAFFKIDTDDSEKYSYPYLQYRLEGQNQICGRSYCHKCLTKLNLKLNINSFKCPYCKGMCFCQRCTIVDSVIKYQATYIQNQGNIEDLYVDSIFYHTQSFPKNLSGTKDEKYKKADINALIEYNRERGKLKKKKIIRKKNTKKHKIKNNIRKINHGLAKEQQQYQDSIYKESEETLPKQSNENTVVVQIEEYKQQNNDL